MAKRTRRMLVVTSRLKAFASFSDAFTGSVNSAWKVLRGSFSSSTGKASASTQTYALAVVPMASPNVTVSAQDMDNGTGLALWVAGSGDWWAVSTGQTGATNCNCQTCNNFTCTGYTCNASYYVCNASNGSNCKGWNSSCSGYNTNNCTGYNSSTCSGFVSVSGNCKTYNKAGNCATYYYSTNCAGYNASTCQGFNGTNCKGYVSNCNGYNADTCTSSTNTCNSASCATGYTTPYSCNCATCYPAFISLMQSVSNTVSEITRWTLSVAARSLKVITSSGTVTAKAYSGTDLTTQIDSDLVYTSVGARIETGFGIMTADSSAYSAGTTLDNFNATKN